MTWWITSLNTVTFQQTSSSDLLEKDDKVLYEELVETTRQILSIAVK